LLLAGNRHIEDIVMSSWHPPTLPLGATTHQGANSSKSVGLASGIGQIYQVRHCIFSYLRNIMILAIVPPRDDIGKHPGLLLPVLP